MLLYVLYLSGCFSIRFDSRRAAFKLREGLCTPSIVSSFLLRCFFETTSITVSFCVKITQGVSAVKERHALKHKEKSFPNYHKMLTVAEHGSKPRNNALCTVCCMETIYMSLRDTTNRAFLNRTPPPFALVHQPKSTPLCTIFQVLRVARNLQGLPIKLFP